LVSTTPAVAGSTPLPTWCPSLRERGDLELLLSGAYRPLTGFLGRSDRDAVAAGDRLADGTPWPVAVTLELPTDLAASGRVTLTDPEGAPLAAMDVAEATPVDGGRSLVAGPLTALAPPAYGAFRRLHLRPDEVSPDGPYLAVVAERPLHSHDLAGLRAAAERRSARILLLVSAGDEGRESLIRAVLAAADELPGARVVVVPLPSSEGCPAVALLGAHVAAAYGATALYADQPLPDSPLPVIPAAPSPLAPAELDALLDAGAPLPAGFTPPAVESELRRGRPPLAQRGLVILFTGYSGSGKSTLARGLYDTLVERGDRTATLLDGDVVRRMLSAGLGFSRADRDLSVRRIGYVAAEVARHGGVAICAPIAPYAGTRADVRAMAEAAGDILLVWVSTPLAYCEARDRKGLYAQARAGTLTGFTGIDDPYDEPTDADLVIDTSERPVSECVAEVVTSLTVRGWLGSLHAT
jgi:sulfate adenylyltransferase